MSRPYWVIFDLGEVVLKWHSCRDAVCQTLNLTVEEFNPIFSRYVTEMELGNITPIQGFTSILNDLHNKSDPAQILSIWLNNFIVIDSTVKLIDKLSQNYSIGMCTNNWIENTNYNKSVYPQIFEHFKFIVDSSVIRSRKPDTQIFIEVEKQSGAHGQEIYFIDDTLANIESAAKFGWQTYLFGDATELEKKLL